MYIYIYTNITMYSPTVYIYVYIYIYIYNSVREMGGAPRNPAPRNHLLVWIVK